MSKIALKPYGVILTGRPYGAQVASELLKQFPDGPVELDFASVYGLGSSFGEEVIVPFARRQNQTITVYSAEPAVRECIDLIAKDFNLKVSFIP